MAISQRNPNTILLAGDPPFIADIPAIEAITPGMILEYHNDSGVLKFGVHDSADAAVAAIVALDQIELNLGIDSAYAAGDLVKAAHLRPGDVFYGIIPSGQNIAFGAFLQSNGDGKLKALGSGVGKFMSLSNPGAVTADTRIRVEVA